MTILSWILIAVIVGIGVALNIWVKTNKKREEYLMDVIGQINLKRHEVQLQEEGIQIQMQKLKGESDQVQQWIKQNEVVLYGVKEQAVNTYKGYDRLSAMLSETLEDEEIQEFGDVHVVYQLKAEAEERKHSLDKWFQQSFKMTVGDYIRKGEGFIDGFNFTIN